MKNLAKWLLRKIKQVDVLEIADLIWDELLPVEAMIDWFCDRLAKLAKKTENKVDDQFVVDLRATLKELLLGKIK